MGYVAGLVHCEQCWLYADDAQSAGDVADLLAAPAPKTKPAKTKLRAPRPAVPFTPDPRPARELVGTAIIERMEQRKMQTQEEPATLEQEEQAMDGAQALLFAAGLLEAKPAVECQLAGDCDACEPDTCPAQRNAMAVRVEPDLPGMLLAGHRAVSLVEPEWPPADDARLQPDDSMADLVEQPAQAVAAHEHGPLNQQQWVEQAHALQSAGVAPVPEYFVDGRRVSREEWQQRQDELVEAQAAQARQQYLAEQPPAPDPFVGARVVHVPTAGDYYVCSGGHVTAQRSCEQCEAAAALEQAQHAAMAAPSQCDTQGLTETDLAALVETEWALDAAAQYGGPLDKAGAEDALEHLLGILERAIEEHPRSQQKRIGPSELGTPCDHCLAAKLAEWDEVRGGGAWLPTIGTAVHSWIEQQLVEHMRAGLDAGRYLAEHKVVTGLVGNQLIPGSCDVLDVVAGMTVDWKVVGATTLKAARGGPSATYRAQQHLYAKGWRDMGARVDWVSIVYLPRNGTSLSQRVTWLEPYDESLAQAALDRAGKLKAMLEQVEQVGGVAARDAFITMLPRLRDARGRIDCFDCKRYADYPAQDVTLDASAGGLVDVD